MSKRLIVVLALLFVVGLGFAYAEVQNVKVSGDIAASGVSRHHFSLNRSQDSGGSNSQFKQNLLMSQIRLRVDADLTDNVIATVRLINERVWNGQNDTSASGNSKIDLDIGYVTLKEFLYSPLSLTIGRQEITFGNGLVIGRSRLVNGAVNIPTDLSERKAFDAIRATLNYDPLIVDLIYAKIRQEGYTGLPAGNRHNVDLAGINASYAINKNTTASAYFFNKKDNFKDNGTNATTVGRGKTDQVNTVGALVTSSPIENLAASAEVAYQFGRTDSQTSPGSLNQSNHDAWALQAMADYTFAKVKTTPKIGASWTFLSGNKNNLGPRNRNWDPMFYDQQLNNITYAILPFTNMNVFNLKGSLKPTEDVTLSLNYGYYDLAAKYSGSTIQSPFFYDGTNPYLNTTLGDKKHLGDAVDITATYDYTEDVQFLLTGGWFKAGPAFRLANKKEPATQLIGSMKVTF